jgi:hypothetical protein
MKKTKGLHEYRFKDNPEERRFSEAWAEMQRGCTLAWLLHEGEQRGYPLDPSARDCVVAATVIQWLGSPVGQGFLADLGYLKSTSKKKSSA